MDCIFCRIAQGTIPAKLVHQDDVSLAFEDLNPQAPVHVLVTPRHHVESLKGATPQDRQLLGHLLFVAAQVAREKGLDTRGYRTVINSGAEAGQTVFHLHLHVLGGRAFHWPPG